MLKRDILKRVRGRTPKSKKKASQADLFMKNLPEIYKGDSLRNEISSIIYSKPFSNCNIALLVRVYIDIKNNETITEEFMELRASSFIKKNDDNLREGFRCTYLSYHMWISEIIEEQEND